MFSLRTCDLSQTLAIVELLIPVLCTLIPTFSHSFINFKGITLLMHSCCGHFCSRETVSYAFRIASKKTKQTSASKTVCNNLEFIKLIFFKIFMTSFMSINQNFLPPIFIGKNSFFGKSNLNLFYFGWKTSSVETLICNVLTSNLNMLKIFNLY